MILINLIKKEIMHFFRNKYNVATMFIFPIILIVVMGFALNGLMNVDYDIFENQKVYYKINDAGENNQYLQVFNSFKESCEKTIKITFEQTWEENSKVKDKINKEQGLAFINIYEDKYDFYRNDKQENNPQKIFRSIFEQYLEKYAIITTVANEDNNIIKDLLKEQNKISIKEEGISSAGINSFTYYTFAELVLIIIYISQITSVSTYQESFLSTLSRLKVSKVSNFSIIISKISLGIIVGILQIIVVFFISTIFLKVNWGENIGQMVKVLISLIIFSSVFGITTSIVFKDIKTSYSLINTVSIVLGFLGGAYVPISLIKSIKILNILCYITPTYWANISLLSLSSGIITNYANISIAISLGLATVLLLIGLIVSYLRVGDNIG